MCRWREGRGGRGRRGVRGRGVFVAGTTSARLRVLQIEILSRPNLASGGVDLIEGVRFTGVVRGVVDNEECVEDLLGASRKALPK